MNKNKKFTISENDIKDYIAGLFEGDGHIWIPKDETKKALPRFHITAHVKDSKLIQHLLKIIGHGYIREKRSENSVVLTIGDKKGLLKIIEWLNGRLYTPKLNYFNKMIDWYNKNTHTHLDKSPLKDPTLNNYWFSGFYDADGHFKIRTTQVSNGGGKAKERYANSTSIDQRIIDPEGCSYKPIMTLIEGTFKGKLKTVIKKDGTYYHLRFYNKESIELICEYFNKYPLLSSKRLDYNCWRDAWIIMKKKTLSEDDKENIRILKSQMNSKRQYFSWHHLPEVKGNDEGNAV